MTTQTPIKLSFLHQRRARLGTHPTQLGIDYIDVQEAGPDSWVLAVNFVFVPFLHLVKFSQLAEIKPNNIRITNAFDNPTGDLIVTSVDQRDINVKLITLKATDPVNFGKSSRFEQTFMLEVVGVPNIDRFFSRAPFLLTKSPSAIDLEPVESVDAPEPLLAEINYLAKDYASFRKLMLDHLSLLVPQWKERHVPDLGIAMVEIMAYAADYLSYYQDGVGTESYLTTARLRVSVRRHVRLLDYNLHDGCNARTWIYFEIGLPDEAGLAADTFAPLSLFVPQGTPVLTKIKSFGQRQQRLTSTDYQKALLANPTVFETMYDATLHSEHNRIELYTWGASEYVLSEGATQATLKGHFPNLKSGDVLIFEALGADPSDGSAVDRLQRTHAVRLSQDPILTSDPLFTSPGQDQPITELEWGVEDALPAMFVVAASATMAKDPSHETTIVRGNIVLADQGQSVPPENLPPVIGNERYTPGLRYKDLTFSVPFDQSSAQTTSASDALAQDSTKAMPAVKLYEQSSERWDSTQTSQVSALEWTARRDLLNSGPFARDFVAETEQDGTISLRFGNGKQGARPMPGSRFTAYYRIGNGYQGNIGPDTIGHVIFDQVGINSVCNPLAAIGGEDAETIDHARLNAPLAFQSQRRCVTESDYKTIAELYTGVQNVVVMQRWTGSWQTVFIYVQRSDGLDATDDFLAGLSDYMEDFRIMGNDQQVLGPHYVPLEITLAVQVAQHYSASDIRQQLQDAFSNRALPGGQYGFFYPAHFTFGQPVYLSQLIALANNIAGVVSVEARTFKRQDQPPQKELATGQIKVGSLEIIRLDNNPQAPENGTINFELRGGV
jgi:hypothetical protein